ncbi:MAG: glycosyltransferase family 2 protein [Clostridia bacterium]|nr:glycosyltransferase family 2 protein [Clostridia bacterium]
MILSKSKIKAAYETLNNFSPNPANSSITENFISDSPKYDLQIIVPTYNCEKYIKECLDSIINQETNYSYKVVVINDGSTDNTAEILKDYAVYDFVEIINQENQGLSGSRNSGLKNIDAKYIMFIDADDVIPANSIDILLKLTKENNCKIISGSYYTFQDKKELSKKHIFCDYCGTVKTNISGFACMKVFKNELFQNLKFPLGYLFEDTMIKYLLISRCSNICLTSQIIYGYRQHAKSITSSSNLKPKRVDCYWVTEQMLKDAFELEIEDKQYLYEITLKQIWSNFGRTQNTPKNIKKSIFILSCNLLEQYFYNFETNSLALKPLQFALRTKTYLAYKAYCTAVSKYLDSKA